MIHGRVATWASFLTRGWSRSLADVLNALPDIPRWIEARAIVLRGCGRVFGSAGGWAIRNEEPDGQLVVVVGEPAREVIAAAVADRPDRVVLCVPESAAATAAALPRWDRNRGLRYQLATAAALAPRDERVRTLGPGDSLGHLPPGLRARMEKIRADPIVSAAFLRGLAVSFAYAHWETEGQFDISIDTADGYRRRGLARIAVSELIRAQLCCGRRPVWGAGADNVGSQRLAERLGFEKVDEIVTFIRG